MKGTIEILPNTFLVEVPKDAKTFKIRNGSYIKKLLVDGVWKESLNSNQHYSIIGTSDSISEEDCRRIVEYNMGGYVDYDIPEKFKDRIVGRLLTAIKSFQSLLKSHSIDESKRYVILKTNDNGK